MLTNLGADFTDRIFQDYPTLENLNLSHNGKLTHRYNLLPTELQLIENLDQFKQTLKLLNASDNKLTSLSDRKQVVTQFRQTSVGVNVLVNLIHLDVSKNMISSLDGLNQLLLLVHLDIS